MTSTQETLRPSVIVWENHAMKIKSYFTIMHYRCINHFLPSTTYLTQCTAPQVWINTTLLLYQNAVVGAQMSQLFEQWNSPHHRCSGPWINLYVCCDLEESVGSRQHWLYAIASKTKGMNFFSFFFYCFENPSIANKLGTTKKNKKQKKMWAQSAWYLGWNRLVI